LAGGVEGVEEALPPSILNMTVPQVGHFPLMALRPFFMTSSTASTISFLALHLTQYPSGIENSLHRRIMRPGNYYKYFMVRLSPASTGKREPALKTKQVPQVVIH